MWGAFKLPARILAELHTLWREPGRNDTYMGTLVNAWLARGGSAFAVHAGTDYVDTGTLHGWRDAVRLLDTRARDDLPGYCRKIAARRQLCAARVGDPTPHHT